MKVSLLNVFFLFTVGTLAILLYTEKKRTTLYSAHTNFSVKIKNQLIDNSPEWVDPNVSPPINVCEIMRVSNEIRASLDRISESSGMERWECCGFTLCPLEIISHRDAGKSMPKKWCYLIRHYRVNNSIAEKCEVLDAFVLMSGDIVISEGHNTKVEEALKRDLKLSLQARFLENL